MKKFICLGILFVGLFACLDAQSQGVAINNDNSSPDASAMLDVKSLTKGMLAPRMTQAQRNAIANPANGLVIYQTDINPGLYYNSGTPAIPAWFIVGNNAGQWLNNGSDIYYALGNVGIGTTSPIEKLHVDGYMHLSNTSSYPFIRFNNTFIGGNSGLEFKENGVNKAWIYYNGFTNSLFLNADNIGGFSPHFVIKSDGNVGLGTDTPASHLHVTKALGTRTGTFGTDISPWTSGTNVAVGNDDEDAVLYVGQAPGREGFLIWQYNTDPSFGYYSVGTYNGANNMTLQEYGGNVGVRTNAPAALFHVAEASPGYTGLFGSNITGYSGGTNVSIGDDNASSLLYVGQSSFNKGFMLWTYNATPSNAHLGIGTYNGSNPLILQEAGGNVGIGTTTPYARLQVNYDNDGQGYLGYNPAYPNYFYHYEYPSNGTGQAALYAFRSSSLNNGTGYGVYASNSATNGLFLLGGLLLLWHRRIQLQRLLPVWRSHWS